MATITINKKNGSIAAAVAASIISAVIAVEGGYVNDPKDPGGETKYGITKSVAVANGFSGSMKAMTQAQATAIYESQYIDKPGFDDFVMLSPTVTAKLVDAGVNTGPSRPSKWLQTALNSLSRGGKDFPTILVDGKVGPGTVNAYKYLQAVRGKQTACELTIKLLDAQQATYYMSLTNLSQYTPGWVDNRIGNVPISRCANDGEILNAGTQIK